MRRREFISLLGSAATWPLAARAQQPEQMRRIGVLMGTAPDDPPAQANVSAFQQRLQELGWIQGGSIRIYYRWAEAKPNRARVLAKELIEFRPDVIVGHSTVPVVALVEATHTIPIVFVNFVDPVGRGLIPSLARPGGNLTGFTNFEPSIAGKWLEILKELARDRVGRVAVLGNSETTPYDMMMHSVEATAPSLAIKPFPAPAHNAAEIERVITALSSETNVGLVVLPDIFTGHHSALIISLVAHSRVPAIYPFRFFAETGGLVSYGLVPTDNFRQAASYVDRILRGENPSELPVQAPTKFELVINLKTAKALGLEVPLHLQQLADEVIE